MTDVNEAKTDNAKATKGDPFSQGHTEDPQYQDL